MGLLPYLGKVNLSLLRQWVYSLFLKKVKQISFYSVDEVSALEKEERSNILRLINKRRGYEGKGKGIWMQTSCCV